MSYLRRLHRAENKLARTKRVKRVVLGVGHPWLHNLWGGRTGKMYDAVSLYPKDCAGVIKVLKLGNLGGYNKIRLVAEIIK